MAEISAGTLYEMNQSIMATQKPMTEKREEVAKKELKAYFMNHREDEYFMLLCKEVSDYTVFHITTTIKCGFAVNELIETLKNRGTILSINPTEDNIGFEIWVKNNKDDFAHAYYLFSYKWGVIEC